MNSEIPWAVKELENDSLEIDTTLISPNKGTEAENSAIAICKQKTKQDKKIKNICKKNSLLKI